MPLACYHTGVDCCQSLPSVGDVDAAFPVVLAADVVAAAAVVAAPAVVAASLPSRMQWIHASASRRAHHQEYHEEIIIYIASPRQ